MNQSLLQLASRCRGEALKDKAAAANMKLRIQQLEQQAANDESEIVGLRCVGLEVRFAIFEVDCWFAVLHLILCAVDECRANS